MDTGEGKGGSWKCTPDPPLQQRVPTILCRDQVPTLNTTPGVGYIQQVPSKVNLPGFWLFQVSGILWDA